MVFRRRSLELYSDSNSIDFLHKTNSGSMPRLNLQFLVLLGLSLR
jgi:hypothetical protein